MTDYKSYLSTIIRQSLSNDMELYQNVYQKVKPTLLSGNALICANRCSMELLGNVKEYNMTITNYGLLSLKGSGSTKVILQMMILILFLIKYYFLILLYIKLEKIQVKVKSILFLKIQNQKNIK